jgi:Icc-related predicted phosphoesterase
MKIAYCSDLHLEFGDLDLKNTENADILIIAGDTVLVDFLHTYPKEKNVAGDVIGKKQFYANRFRAFFDRISEEFPHTLIIAGNHEFYHGKWHDSLDHFRKEINHYPNITFLENDSLILDNVKFIGGTLWTDLNNRDPITMYDITGKMNDYNLIRNDRNEYGRITAHDTIIRHKTTLDYILNSVSSKRINIVISHHAPSFQSVAEKYRGNHVMNGGYCSALERIILDHSQIKYWIHGHIHTQFDYMIGNTNVLCNPRGYWGEQESANNFTLKHFTV